MNTIGWIILLILILPAIGLLVWAVLAASFVRIPSGSLGLLLVKGRATDTTLLPGAHFVPALRRRMVEEYPSVEQSYRAGETGDDTRLDRFGPAVQVALGDRTTATVPYTVRFRIVPEQLRLVHERFGPDGVMGVVRDDSARAVAAALGAEQVGVDSLFGAARPQCAAAVAQAVTDALSADGLEVTTFVLGAVDLGRTGEVIQATVRARLDLEQEQAAAATRVARAVNDAQLEGHLTPASEAAWRYREPDLWRELVARTQGLQVAMRPAGPGTLGVTSIDRAEPPADPAQQ